MVDQMVDQKEKTLLEDELIFLSENIIGLQTNIGILVKKLNPLLLVPGGFEVEETKNEASPKSLIKMEILRYASMIRTVNLRLVEILKQLSQ